MNHLLALCLSDVFCDICKRYVDHRRRVLFFGLFVSDNVSLGDSRPNSRYQHSFQPPPLFCKGGGPGLQGMLVGGF